MDEQKDHGFDYTIWPPTSRSFGRSSKIGFVDNKNKKK